MSEHYYKFLNGRTCANGGHGGWPEPYEWTPRIANLKPCRRGWHILTEEQILGPDGHWLGSTLWRVEARGQIIKTSDKVVAESARLLQPVESWTHRNVALFGACCAARVFPIYERFFPQKGHTRELLEGALQPPDSFEFWRIAYLDTNKAMSYLAQYDAHIGPPAAHTAFIACNRAVLNMAKAAQGIDPHRATFNFAVVRHYALASVFHIEWPSGSLVGAETHEHEFMLRKVLSMSAEQAESYLLDYLREELANPRPIPMESEQYLCLLEMEASW